ncbi:helix-turn-helix domain-containing protein [Bartonella heixiaziensis]|uniref:helix-turn-helix domain-containing protein n=1 Tax=Bartonella heixiaziensis TaxID=1461000 RepID=UPI003D1A0224
MSISRVPCVRFYSNQFLKELIGLQATEKGVYTTLVLLMKDKKAPLINNVSYLSGWCGCSVRTFQKALKALISTGHITQLENGSLWYGSTAFEYDDNKFSERASKAAIARWHKHKGEEMHVQ